MFDDYDLSFSKPEACFKLSCNYTELQFNEQYNKLISNMENIIINKNLKDDIMKCILDCKKALDILENRYFSSISQRVYMGWKVTDIGRMIVWLDVSLHKWD